MWTKIKQGTVETGKTLANVARMMGSFLMETLRFLCYCLGIFVAAFVRTSSYDYVYVPRRTVYVYNY